MSRVTYKIFNYPNELSKFINDNGIPKEKIIGIAADGGSANRQFFLWYYYN